MSEKLRQIYSAEHVKTKVSAADQDLEGPEIPQGEAVRIDAFYAIDITVADKTIRLGYKKAGVEYWFKRQNAGTGAYGISQDRPIILVQAEKPIARVESATLNDTVLMVCRGVYL